MVNITRTRPPNLNIASFFDRHTALQHQSKGNSANTANQSAKTPLLIWCEWELLLPMQGCRIFVGQRRRTVHAMPSKVRTAAPTTRRQSCSGLDVAVTFSHLQTSCTDHARGCEIGVENELVFMDVSVFERDFADFKAHIA